MLSLNFFITNFHSISVTYLYIHYIFMIEISIIPTV